MTIKEQAGEAKAIKAKIGLLKVFMDADKTHGIQEVSIELLGGLLIDVNRIANALETIAENTTPDNVKVGESNQADLWDNLNSLLTGGNNG